jgi:hypothetical protein
MSALRVNSGTGGSVMPQKNLHQEASVALKQEFSGAIK